MKHSKRFLRTAVVYVRDYSKESKNIYGATEQENTIRSYASENGYRILEIFKEEEKSGKTFERPQFQAMMEYIRTNKWKVKFLIVSDIQRLSTNPAELGKLKYFLKGNGVELISIVQSMLKYAGRQAK